MDMLAESTERSRHYLALDGLRGLAALVVVVLHRRWWLDVERPFYGGLAVDFFFMLSGFVIAHAYGAKLSERRLGFRTFVVLRLIRLYPLLILGAVLATGALLFEARSAGARGDAITALAAFPFNALALPTWYFSANPFDPNFPAWSLFYEIIANVAFALAVPRLSLRALERLTAVTGMLLLGMIFAANDFGRIGTNWPTLGPGLVRVAFPFCAGVLLHRLHQAGRLRFPPVHFAVLGAVLLAALFMPVTYNRWLESAYLAGAIFVLFPLIIALGAAGEPSARWMSAVKFSGFVSYPLYILHIPLLRWMDQIAPLGLLPGAVRLFVAVAATIGIAWLAGRYYDLPLRKAIGARRQRRAAEARTH